MRHRPALVALFLALPVAVSPVFAAVRQGFSLSVVVDGCEAPEYEHAGRIYVEALRGRNFSLRITNPTSQRVAVALSVDGRNVIDARRTTAGHAAKWILGPGQTAEIPGWQVSGETSRKFFFTETSRSYAKWLGDTANVGTIEAVFFREKRAPVAREWAAPLEAPEARRDSSPATGSVAGDAQKKESDRMAATGIGERTDFAVQWIEFEEDPDPAARVALRYEFRRELVRLGVLPRPDDALAARERARGFEPRYAPDPDRPR
jgi:hypothetical protein